MPVHAAFMRGRYAAKGLEQGPQRLCLCGRARAVRGRDLRWHQPGRIFSLLPSISPWMAAALRLLIRLTALLLQGSLLLRIQKADRLHAAAGLLALLFGLLFYRL